MSERAQPVPGQAKPWRCSHCGHVLAVVVNGRCTICHPITLRENNAPVLLCPVCGSEATWYSPQLEANMQKCLQNP